MSGLARVRIKLIEQYGKYTALLRNRAFCDSELYRKNMKQWDKCFENRKTETHISEENLIRIVTAYNKAMKDMVSRDYYYISDEWVPIYENYMEDIIECLTTSNYRKLESLYENFFREKFSVGLCGLPTNMERFYLKNPNIINKRWFLIDACYRINLLKTELGEITASELATPLIGNPYGVMYKDVFVRSGADYHYYYAKKIRKLLSNSSRKRVIEIGGGFGGMAAFLMKDELVKQYVDIDLPETLALATYYLMSAFPNDKFLLYGEQATNSDEHRFLMLPSFAIEDIDNLGFGVGFNSYSFSEMNFEAANNYIKHLGKLNVEHMLHINHTQNSLTKADKFRFEDYDYKLLDRSDSKWNFGRSGTADEFEYHYSKEI